MLDVTEWFCCILSSKVISELAQGLSTKRCISLFALALSFGGLLFQFVDISRTYFDYEVITDTSFKEMSRLELPDVHFCPDLV